MATAFTGRLGDYERLQHACAELQPPFAIVDLDAFTENAAALARRSRGKAIRIASKSLRCRALLQRLLSDAASPFSGALALTVSEALWLAEHGVRDVVVGYPSVDRQALSMVAGDAWVVLGVLYLMRG